MGSALSDLKILLVEDQSEARAMIRNMMGELGITQIFEASDGREALAFLDSAYDFIDLLVCDWNMPGMTGVDLLRQLRSVDPTMPFLMVTGRIDMDSVVEAKSAGVTAYIRKPFSSKQLEAKLRIILHRMAA
ncbi:MAG: response regulator [Rhodospirillales bacterium]|nr:response regulator [Rhodospirillales bacterium]